MTQTFLFRFEEGGKYEHDGDHYDGYHLRLDRDYLRDNEQGRQGVRDQFYMHFETMPKGTHQQRGVSVIKGKPHFYEKAIVKEARLELTRALKPHKPKKPSDKPIKLTVWFYFDVKDRKLWGEVKPTRPDTDNLQKLLKDCMTDVGFWLDDAQVVEETVGKYYSEKATIAICYEEVLK